MTDTLTIVSEKTEAPRAPRVPRARNRLLWPMRALLDRNDDPSATRIMAFVIVASNWAGHPVDPWTAALCLATCFGYSMFKSVIDKTNMSATATGAISSALSFTKAKTDAKTETITENINKQFTYTATGEPTQSLPAQPDARTPSGSP